MNRLIKGLLITHCYLFLVLCSSASFAAARYQLKSGAVLDSITRLIWQEKSLDQTYTWSEAEAYCQQQNTEKLGEYSSGWRLPNVSELLTIVNDSRKNPVFDQDAFFGPIGNYWTSTPKHDDAGEAWHVNFYQGDSIFSAKNSHYYVRCVR